MQRVVDALDNLGSAEQLLDIVRRIERGAVI
jgi:hypothetical protein